jgi:CRP-like cAMP-binding protein
MSTSRNLSQIFLFADLSEEERQMIARQTRTRVFRAGEVIFHKDDPAHTLYILTSGRVKIYTLYHNGEEVIYDILSPPDFFGELNLLDGEDRSSYATALEKTEALLLDRQPFLECLERFPPLTMRLLQVVSERLRHANSHIQTLASLDVYGRVLKVLTDLALDHGTHTREGESIALRITQSDLAGYVGSSRERVNKVLAHFRQKGYISLVRRQILIHRADALRDELRRRLSS